MDITDFTHSHIEDAKKLALFNYEEERSHVIALPLIKTLPDHSAFAYNN